MPSAHSLQVIRPPRSTHCLPFFRCSSTTLTRLWTKSSIKCAMWRQSCRFPLSVGSASFLEVASYVLSRITERACSCCSSTIATGRRTSWEGWCLVHWTRSSRSSCSSPPTREEKSTLRSQRGRGGRLVIYSQTSTKLSSMCIPPCQSPNLLLYNWLSPRPMFVYSL